MLPLSLCEGPEQTLNLKTWLDFIVQQEYHFIKNIYSQEYIKSEFECFKISFIDAW